MGGQDQWGYGQQGHGGQQPPQQPGGWGAPQQPQQQQPMPPQQSPQPPYGGGQPMPQQQPQQQYGGGGRPKLTGVQTGLIGLSFVVVLAAGVGSAFAANSTGDAVAPKPKPVAKPSPSAKLPDAPTQPSDSPSDAASPSPSPSESDLNVMTAKERGPIHVKGLLGARTSHGGPTIIRTGTAETTDCNSWLIQKAPNRGLFGQQKCQRLVRGSYVSEDRKVYVSITIFQFPDQAHRKVINDKVQLRDMPIRFMLPPRGYDTSKLKSSKDASVMVNNNSTSECLVITQSAFADGRKAVGEDENTLSTYAQLAGSDVKIVLGLQQKKKH